MAKEEYDPKQCIKHEEALFGNGKEGLIVDVAVIKKLLKVVILPLTTAIFIGILGMLFKIFSQ